ncbi:TolC family protein [Acidicapsa acidisoli]|uniref:TolC family protein n=1 Tax=Acidicapsa acidisoli TaxID=1615681 RepID=UPI0021DF828D|nr:TolC family protein [Acidicapsa acidisoli]
MSCVLVSAAAAQQPPQTPAAATALANAPAPSLSLAQTPGSVPGSIPGSASPQDGPLYLSLQQVFQMALKNNLDIEIERVDQTIADQSIPLAKGGGLPRPINYTVADTPAGEAPAAVPLLSFSSPGLTPLSVDPITQTISSSYNTSRVLEGSHSLSLSPTPYSGGSPVPGFDAQLQGRYGWLRRNPAVSLLTLNPSAATPADTATTDNTLGDTLLTKGFSPGTTIQLGVNDFVQSFYSGRSSAVPFSHPNAYALIAQPLFRGAGHANNTRYIAIAKTNKKISAAVLEQQIIGTIAGVENLYVDLMSLQESVKVQEQALTAARLLLHNDQEQLNVGRMPPIEIARAQSLVTSSQLLLTQTISLRDQQQVVLRTLLDPHSLTSTPGNTSEIVATDALSPPETEPGTDTDAPLPELIRSAWEKRPDVQQARLQLTNGERQVASSANAARPEIDLYGSYESRGVVIPGLTAIGGDSLTGNAPTDPVPTGGSRSSTVYETGIQFSLPVQNRVAEANLGADKALLKQQQMRVTQLESQVAAEVRNAITALHAAKSAADAATEARELQTKLLDAAQESFQAGYTTNLALIEQQTYLAQAQTTEVIAKAAWLKASAQLDRVLGHTLEKSGISLKADRSGSPQH